MINAIRMLLLVLIAVPLQAQERITIDVENEFLGQLGYQLSFTRGAWYATFRGAGSDPAGIVEFDIENGDFTPINVVPFQNLSINEAYGFAVTRDGKYIVVGGDSLVHLIDLTGKQIREWAAHSTPARHEEYSIAACDSSNRIYIATNNSPMVIVYSEFGLPLDTLSTTGAISRTVYIRDEDEAILVLSQDSSGCALDVYTAGHEKLMSYDYDHPLPGLPGAGDPSGRNNYRDWKRIAASDTKVLISQWSGYQTSAHRILVFDKTLSVLHCEMMQTADTRVDNSINFPSGMDLNSDECRFLDKMSDGSKYLNQVYGSGFCNADPPEAAAKLKATYFTDHVTLQWDASPTSGVRYRVYRAQVHGQYNFIAPPVCMTTGTECTDMNGVSPGTAYCYVVRAERDGYESASSNEVCGSTPDRIVNLTIIPARVEFGYVPAGTSDTITVGLRNDAGSNSSLAYSAHALAHPFSLTDTTARVLAPGQSRNIDIVFSPAGSGEARQDWIIDHNATNQTNPLSIPVSGGDTLEHPDIFMSTVPSTIDFGYITVGQSDTIAVTIKNDLLSTDTLEFVAAAMSPPFFLADTTARQLAPGDSTIIQVFYSPSAADRITRHLRVDHNATNLPAPLHVTVAGGEFGTDSLIIAVEDERGADIQDAIVRRLSPTGSVISQRMSGGGDSWVAGPVARWDSIPAGDYVIEVYHDAQRPPYTGEEFWGSMQVAVVGSGHNTYRFTRREPCTTWIIFEQQGSELHLNNPLAGNEEVTAIVTVTNHASAARNVRGVLAIDRDMQSSYDHELSFGPAEIPSRGEHRFFVTFTPRYDDFYHDGVMIEASGDSTFGLTDSWAWSPPQCTYHPDAERKGELTVQPETFCDENAVWYDRFDDLGNWTKGDSRPRKNLEDCTFLPSNAALGDSVLTLTAQSLYEGVGYPGDYYYGGQVTSFQTFGPDQDYSVSCSMKPSAENGVINSFGVVSLLEEDLRDEDRCSENYHHVDIEITSDPSGMLKCMFTTGTRAYQCLRDEEFNEHCPGYAAPDHDRIESSSYILLPVSYSESFHKYGFRWSGNSAMFMIDDSVVSVHHRDDAVLKIVPTRSAHIRIGAWIADRSWTGPGDSVPKGTLGVCEVNAVCVSDNATSVSPAVDMDYRLSPPYPNPSRGSIDVEFELDAAEYVTLRIYDIHGVEVETLVDQTMPPGMHHSRWNTDNVNSGIYYYVLTTRDSREMRKIVVL